MTRKLYWNDSHLIEFSAKIAEVIDHGEKSGLVLDQTAFYPTGGGQPCDLGVIGSAEVEDVDTLDGERIVHWVRAGHGFSIGESIECRIDWNRRREMLQQHTGQHILSQAFFRLFGAETKGFRITDRSTEIDLTLEAHPSQISESIDRAEELANNIVFDNRQIRIHEVTPDEASTLPLRKESFISDCVRVVEIDDYDWSPCGGTHARRTGEVGLIAVKSWERAKRMTRVHFVCGVRALGDYRIANRISASISEKLSVGREEAGASIDRIIEENKQAARRIRELVNITSEAEAQKMIDLAELIKDSRYVQAVFDDRDLDSLKLLAHRITEQSKAIAILASREADAVRLVFARSEGLNLDMSSMIKFASELLGGRGGGRPDFAQGGGSNISEIENALIGVREKIKAAL